MTNSSRSKITWICVSYRGNTVNRSSNKAEEKKVNFTYESVALFGCTFPQMSVINLAGNALTDDFFKVLRSKKSMFFCSLKTLKISFNNLTDTTLELMVQCCDKVRTYRNFQQLE